MVHMMSTTRAGRPSKEKTPKAQQSHTNKSEGPPNSSTKNQATADQMKVTRTVRDKQSEELEKQIDQVADLTGRSKDEALIALHDCDYDLSRAICTLLENEDQGEWQEKKGKKKKNVKSETEADQNHEEKLEQGDRNHEPEYMNNERSSSAPRPRRNDRAPPRFQKAAGRGRNDEECGDGGQRGGERGRGRGRGSRGRGRGRGAGSTRRDYSDNSRDTFQNGPQIDTWTNETADSKQESSFGTWGDMTEDWNDEWQGSLNETKVFTASTQDQSASKGFSSDNDAKMFNVSNIETQVYSGTIGDSLNDSGRYQHSASPLQSHALSDHMAQDHLGNEHLVQSLAQKPIGQNSLGHSAIGQNLGQRLDLGMLLGKPNNDSAASVTRQSEELAKQTADFMAQFQKQATESIKSAVGICNSSQSASMGLSGLTAEQTNVMNHGSTQSAQGQTTQAEMPRTSLGPTASPNAAVTANANQHLALQQQQRAKPQKTKLPPPSKIPQSAVVMPGGLNYGGGVDVKFGNWDQGESGFSFGAVPQSNAGVSFSAPTSLNNHHQNNHKVSQAPNAKPGTDQDVNVTQKSVNAQASAMSAIMDSLGQQKPQTPTQSPRPGSQGVYQAAKPPPSTPPKDYTQSTKISSPPSSQSERKSPYQLPGSHPQEPAKYSQSSSYTSTYNAANAYIPTVSSSNVASGSSSYGSQDYRNQSSAFQSSRDSSSGYTNQGQSALYPNSSQTGSSYPSSQSAYQSSGGSTGGYQSQSSYHNRDSQSTPAFQSSVVSSQSSAYHQSSVTAQAGSGSSYQRDSDNVYSDHSQSSAYGGGNRNDYGSSSSAQKSSVSGIKLSDSIGKLSVKDSSKSDPTGVASYDTSSASASVSLSKSSVSAASISSQAATTSSIATGSVNVSSVLGFPSSSCNSAVSTGVSTSLSSTSKSANMTVNNTTSKAPPNPPPGVAPVNFVPAAFPIAATFPPMYSYEDILLTQQRLGMQSYYDSLPFQPTPTSMPIGGVDHKLAASQQMAYSTGVADGSKMNRVDAQSPTNPAQTSAQSQQQQFMHSIPPGYPAHHSYFFPHQMPPNAAGYGYPPMIPLSNLMTQVTNAGCSSASNQFSKTPYGFGSGTGTQDYSKAFIGVSQSQSKGSASTASSMPSTADLGCGSGYAKSHSQAAAYDKSGFAAGTPPPFNMTAAGLGAAGTQAGQAIGAPPATYVQYVAGLAPQPNAAQQMLAHQLHQDAMGNTSRGGQQSSGQGKGLGAKTSYGATAYWGAN